MSFDKELFKKRCKNAGLWSAFAALVLAGLQLFGVQVVPESYNMVVNSGILVLVGLGILSNPTTDTSGFGDDKESE